MREYSFTYWTPYTCPYSTKCELKKHNLVPDNCYTIKSNCGGNEIWLENNSKNNNLSNLKWINPHTKGTYKTFTCTADNFAQAKKLLQQFINSNQ